MIMTKLQAIDEDDEIVVVDDDPEDLKLWVSLFDGKTDNKPRQGKLEWKQICERIKKPRITKEKDTDGISPAKFQNNHRGKADVVELSMLILDYDHGVTFDEVCADHTTLGYVFAAHTTWSHKRITESNKEAEERIRILIPLDKPIPADRYKALWQWMYKKSGKKIDPQPKSTAQMFYLPSKYDESSEYEYHIFNDGVLLDWETILEQEEEELAEAVKADLANNSHSVSNGKPKTLKANVNEYSRFETSDLFAAKAKFVQYLISEGYQVGSEGAIRFKCVCEAGKHSGQSENSGIVYVGNDYSITCGSQQKNRVNDLKSILVTRNIHLVAEETKAALDDDLQSSIESDLVDLTDRDFQPPSYFHQFIMERQINLLASGEGTGKTFATLALVAELSGKGIKTVYLSCEDDEDEIGRRLKILNADFNNIRVICFKSKRYNLSPIGIECILAAASSFGASLIVIDPLSSYAGGRKLNDEASIREALDPLREKLKLHNISVFVIHHWNKEGKIANSRQITAAARLVTQIFPSRDVPGAMVMVITKTNNSSMRQASSLAYRITSDPDDPNKPCFEWLLEHPNVTWEDLQNDTRHLEKLMIDYINENQDDKGEVLLSDLRKHCAEEPYCYNAEQVRNVYYRKWGIILRKEGKKDPIYWIKLPPQYQKKDRQKPKKIA